ncbi:hypothetical protein ANCCAN_13489 [Ancylostoma caninum]|uniref:Uncharacterized protein n=1 Tax=Ancylostoma caninum TaxID=29170 RepID=A0A368G843_ANCCA|nr:hypothetical protein ANCCAN_13489 [Ancylostoma caninum]
MSTSAHNHNDKYPVEAGPLTSATSDRHPSNGRKSAAKWLEGACASPSVRQRSTRRTAKTDVAKKPTLSRQVETPKTSRLTSVPSRKPRALETLNSAKCTGKQVGTPGDMAINTEKRRRGRPRKNSPPRNRLFFQ